MAQSWSYRVTQETDTNGDVVFAIRECWVRKDAKKPYKDSDYTSWSENAIAPIGENLDELRWELQKMLEACDKAIIDISEKKQ